VMRLPLFLVAIVPAFGMLLSPVPSSLQQNVIYADESETIKEQGLGQENIGSGESINTNCLENTIDSPSVAVCGGSPTGPGGPPGGAIALTVERCLELSSESFRCNIIDPPGLRGPLICGLFPVSGASSNICNPGSGGAGFIIALSCETPDFSLGRQTIGCFEIALPLPAI
jgi:hypothetical protein